MTRKRGRPKRIIRTTTGLPGSACPACGNPLTAATSIEGGRPKVGDATICLKCGEILMFGEGMHVRAVTPEERAAVRALPSYQQVARVLGFAVSAPFLRYTTDGVVQ